MNIIEGVQSDWRSLTLPFFLKFIGEKALSLSLLTRFLVVLCLRDPLDCNKELGHTEGGQLF